jgi:hypothetical protein
MSTRLYFKETANANLIYSPGFDAEWNKTTNAVRRELFATKQSTTLATSSDSENTASQPYDVLLRQYYSEPLAAQTISGTVGGQIRAYESNAAADFCIAVTARVVSADGATSRGTLFSYFPGSLASEFAGPSTLTNRYAPPAGTALSSVDALDGDRIVIEIGFRSFNTSTTAYTGYMSFGDAAASDLAVDETTTTANNPWIEFSGTINFLAAAEVSQLFTEYLYSYVPEVEVSQLFTEYLYTLGPDLVKVSRIFVEYLYVPIQVITVTDISTSESFGNPAVANILLLSPTGVTSSEVFGSASLELFILPSGISSLESFGTPTLDLVVGGISPSGIASEEAFGSPLLVPGAAHISPSGITSSEAFGTPTIIPGTAVIAPSGITTREAFGTARIGMVVLPSGISSEEDVSSPYVFPGGVHIISSGITSAESFGTPLITCGQVAIVLEGIVSLETFGTPLLTYIVAAAGDIGSEEAFGTATLNLSIQPNGIDSQEDFGAPWVIPGPVWLYPSGIDSEEGLGTPQVNLILHAGTIDSEEAFGTPELFCGPVTVFPYGILSAEAFGRAIVWVEPSQYFVLELDSLRIELVDGDIDEIILSADQPQRMVVNG